MKVKLDFETTEETIILLNEILAQIIKQKGNGLTEEQKELLEKFRLKMIVPVVVNSERPLADAFLMFAGEKKKF